MAEHRRKKNLNLFLRLFHNSDFSIRKRQRNRCRVIRNAHFAFHGLHPTQADTASLIGHWTVLPGDTDLELLQQRAIE
jgi:hypothetical protein